MGDHAGCLAPDLRTRGPDVRLEVCFILILIEHVKLGLGRMIHRSRYGSFRCARCRAERIFKLFDIGSSKAEHHALFRRNFGREGGRQLIAFEIAKHGKPHPRVSTGRLHQPLAWPHQATFFPIAQ